MKERLRDIGFHKIIVTILISLVFVILIIIGDYGLAGDSRSYLSLNIYREPVYTIIVCIMQSIFGAEHFYMPLAILQNVIAALSCIGLVYTVNRYILKDRLTLYIAAILSVIPHLMTPIFSRSHLVLTNKIMEEAVTFSEYYLLMIFVIKVIYDTSCRRRNILLMSLVTSLLILTRGQMSITAIGIAILLIIIAIRERNVRPALQSVVIMVAIFIGTMIITRSYNYLVSGRFIGTVSGKTTFATNVMYVSGMQDGISVEDDKLRMLYDKLMSALDEDKLLYEYAEGGVLSKAIYHESCHDTIKYDYFEPVKNEVYNGLMGDNYTDYQIIQDEIAGELTGVLLPGCIGRFVTNYCCMCVLGLVRTVAVEKSVLWIVAVLVYMVYLVLLIQSFRKNGWTEENVLGVFVLIMVLGFVCGTSLYIMCLSRYVIYNLPFVYLMIYTLFRKNREIGVK